MPADSKIMKMESLPGPEVIMNGRQLYTTTMWDEKWKDKIAATKFVDWPDLGSYKKGKIVLYDHGHAVWYRNIKIKSL